MTLIHWEDSVVEGDIGETAFALWRIVDELLQFFNDQIHDLFLVFVD